jgi:predicted transcriptional regulator
MTRSKIETYVDTLDLLAHTGPLSLSHVMYKINDAGRLGNCMAFLVKQGLVEERTAEMKSVLYEVTKRGLSVIRFFGENKKIISDTE